MLPCRPTLIVPTAAAAQPKPTMTVNDPRHISNGYRIPCENYCDQPYVVKTDDGAWLCVLTTGRGVEGERGQHVVVTRSTDMGRTWSELIDVEPADGPEASYAVLLKTPGGRIYAFYNHNTDNLRAVKADDPPYQGGWCRRVDSLGYFVFKFSDDSGRTWSPQRYVIPVREFAIDRENAYQGKVRFFWNVGKPFVRDGVAYVPLHKVGGFGHGFFTRSEGVFLRSDNLLTESDPTKIRFETLPDGDVGLRTPPGGGAIAEEHSTVVLSDGSLYCVYRTIDGHPCHAYSRDGGRTWTPPEYMTYTPGGRRVKHPRAANFVWRCANGKYLYWFHNHGGRWYDDRNPAWLCGGVERDSPDGKVIHWSQPEILLYDDDTFIRMSYPDLIEEGGRYFVTETQKHVARVHEIPTRLVEGLWRQFNEKQSVTKDGLILSLPNGGAMPSEVAMPRLPEFQQRDNSRADYGAKDLRAGFSVEMWLTLDALDAGQILLDNRTSSGQGLLVSTSEGGAIKITLNDGRSESSWTSDPGALQAGKRHHVVAIVDGGPKIISFVLDGVLCDGGAHRQFGWGRFTPLLRHANGGDKLRIARQIHRLRIYNRSLRTSEAVGNYRAELDR